MAARKREIWIVWAGLVACAAAVIALMLLPPVLHACGLDRAARAIMAGYALLCHQEPGRSFHILGHPLMACSRCVSMYAGGLLGLLLAPLLGAVGRPEFPSRWVLLMGLAPLALDAGLDALGMWTSTFSSRSLSGLAAGMVAAFYVLPGFTDAVFVIKKKFFRIPELVEGTGISVSPSLSRGKMTSREQ